MDKQTCSICGFLNKESDPQNIAHPISECRANAPTAIGYVTPNELGTGLNLGVQSVFPRVSPEMWCGQFWDGVEEPEFTDIKEIELE